MNPQQFFPALILALGAVAPMHATGTKPNILFIITDQQFADVMSCRMGKQFINTPAMDGLAANGILFTRAYSANPLCMPSRNAMFTGRYPHETGIMTNDPPPGGMNPEEFPSMGRYFKEAGYDTAYSGKWHLCYPLKDSKTHGFEIMKGNDKGGHDASVTDGALKFLARPHEKPFLLVTSFMNPHNICEWARRLSGRDQKLTCGEIGEPPSLDRLPPAPFNLARPTNEPDGMTFIRRAYQVPGGPFPVGEFTTEDWRKLRWGYYRMAERVDMEIARVLEALRKAGLEENTLIIFTADHGECAGAHGFNQKTVLYEESIRVPMIVSWKGKTPANTSDKFVNTGIDILPTLLDSAGLEIPEKFPGRSLLPLAKGGKPTSWRDHVVSEDHMIQTGTVDGIHPTMQGRMVRTDRYKYCVYSRGNQRESLVDLQTDPGEMHDLATDPKSREILLEHRALLARFATDQKDAQAQAMLADDVKPIPFTPTQPAKKSGKKKRDGNPDP